MSDRIFPGLPVHDGKTESFCRVRTLVVEQQVQEENTA